jgi:hypothetical protein
VHNLPKESFSGTTLGNANPLLQEQLRIGEEAAAMLLRENALLKG